MKEDIEEIINALPDEPEFVPDEALYRVAFFNINPIGDFNESFRVFNLRYESILGLPTPEGDGNINFKFLCIHYKSYLNWWETAYSDKEEKYIPKVERLQDPLGYFNEELYNRIFKSVKQAKDYYLFGKNSFQTLRRKLSIFKKEYLKENVEIIEEKKIVTNPTNINKPKDEDNPF